MNDRLTPPATVVLSAHWLGSTRNSNLDPASTGHVLLVHDDVEPDTDTAKAMQKCLRANPSAGIICGRLMDAFDKTLHAGYAFEPETPFGFVDRLRGCTKTHLDAIRETQVAAGSSELMLITREALQATGGFDPSLAYEPADIDLCLRLSLKGFGTFYCPRASASRTGCGAHDFPTDARADTVARLESWDHFYEKWSQLDCFTMGELGGLHDFALAWAEHPFLPFGRTRAAR